MSFRHSSRIIAPLVRWLFPHLSDETIHGVVFGVRKLAHFSEYALLALLLWRALPQSAQPRPPFWRRAGLALLMVALYAASDEFHQMFVPSREASVVDVLLDTTGGACALLFLWVLGRWRKRW